MLSLATNHVDNHLQNSSIKSSLGKLLKSSRLKWKWAINDKLILNSKAPVKYEIFVCIRETVHIDTNKIFCVRYFVYDFKGALNTKYLANTLTDMISLCTYAVIFFLIIVTSTLWETLQILLNLSISKWFVPMVHQQSKPRLWQRGYL